MPKTLSWNLIKGIYDSLQIFKIYETIKSSQVRNTLALITFINGLVYIGFILFYTYIVNPIVTSITNKIFILGYLIEASIYGFYIFWLLIIFLLCNIITSYKIDTIFEKCTTQITKKEIKPKHSTILYHLSRIFVIISFVVYIYIMNYIPKIFYLRYIVLSLLNSFYVFQYIFYKKSTDLRGIFFSLNLIFLIL